MKFRGLPSPASIPIRACAKPAAPPPSPPSSSSSSPAPAIMAAASAASPPPWALPPPVPVGNPTPLITRNDQKVLRMKNKSEAAHGTSVHADVAVAELASSFRGSSSRLLSKCCRKHRGLKDFSDSSERSGKKEQDWDRDVNSHQHHHY